MGYCMVPVFVKGSEQFLQAFLNTVHLENIKEIDRQAKKYIKNVLCAKIYYTKLTFGGASLRAAV